MKWDELMSTPIHRLGLSNRARNALNRVGCSTLADISKLTESALLRLPHVGTATVQDIRYLLSQYNMKLADDCAPFDPTYAERAVNSHKALVEALERFADVVQGGDKLESLEPWALELVRQARAALKLAKEGS